ncbi:MAG: hypothetical protein AAGF26_12150 [Cyanobacteria bacterium P01_G01_bin.49]
MIKSIAIPKNYKRSLKKRKNWLIANLVGTIFIVLSVGQLAAYGQTKSTEAVRAELDDVYEAYLGRKLSQKELDQVTKEYIPLFGSNTCEAKCVQDLEAWKVNIKIFQTQRGQPEDLAKRHSLIAHNYLWAETQGTLILRLLTEPDPIRVFNPTTKRLMTEKDVIALANLGLFLKSNGSPKHQSFSPKEIDQVVGVLEPLVGSQGKARKMPMLFVIAAELWAGIQRDWSSLSVTEQQSVRDYIQHKSNKPMPLPLYSRLVGFSMDQAKIIQNAEQSDIASNSGSSYLDLLSRYGFLRYMPYGPSF